MRHRNLSTGAALVGLVALVALLSAVWLPYDANRVDIDGRLQPPSLHHPFGTDHFGRDVFTRVARGAPTALAVGLVAVAIGGGLGLVAGAAAALGGRLADEVLMRLMDAVYAFPAILFALLLVAVWGPGLWHGMVAIGLATVPVFARVTRGALLSLREREFVEAARAAGAGGRRLLLRHLLPNAAAPLIVQGTVTFAVAILAEAALSYLGLGTQPPDPSWGRMLREAQGLMNRAPWLALFPGTFIALAVMGFNLLGDGLRDVVDPYTRTGGPARGGRGRADEAA